MKMLQKLSRLGGSPLGQNRVDVQRLGDAFGDGVMSRVRPLLELKNGFYAFEGALHVLPDTGGPGEIGLHEWNSDALWKREYQGVADGVFCFAEDVFGMQFCLSSDAICRFDPETGASELVADTLEEWASALLRDYEVWTGHRIAHEWQVIHGPIPVGSRLVPVIPFVLGGEFSVQNCHLLEAVKGMKYRASIAVQIRDLPDGATVKLRTID
jgi:hypothetical protein